MGTNWSQSQEDSEESGVSLKNDGSLRYKIWSLVRMSFLPRVHLIKSLFSAISGASAKRDDSQGCTAHVKETPPSPKEKPEDLIGADIDSVADDEDWVESSDDLVLFTRMAKGSMESIDSGVSFKSDTSKRGLIHFKDRVSLRPEDLFGADIDSVRDDEDLVKSSDDL